jgi:hypothetical protein
MGRQRMQLFVRTERRGRSCGEPLKQCSLAAAAFLLACVHHCRNRFVSEVPLLSTPPIAIGAEGQLVYCI